MNLRTLKKLSKKAAPFLPMLGDEREQFPAERGENYHGLRIRDRKCWERSRCHQSYKGHGNEIVSNTRAGHRIVMREPYHPLKGTIMVGSISGYYEPEWDEETAWGAMHNLVAMHFTDWETAAKTGVTPKLTRPLKTYQQIFIGAEELAKKMAAENIARFTSWANRLPAGTKITAHPEFKHRIRPLTDDEMKAAIAQLDHDIKTTAQKPGCPDTNNRTDQRAVQEGR